MFDMHTDNVMHIISEPGDSTRYDYVMYRDGPTMFCIAPARSTFKFPQRIDYFDIKGITEINDTINNIAKLNHCNPCTVLECVKTINKIMDNKA